MNNTLIAVDKSGSCRLYLTLCTDLVQEASDIHGCSHLAAAALGRTLACTGLMGLMLKSESDRVTVQIKGDGPAREILCAADASGNVKGYISDPSIELPLKEDGHLNVGAAVGNGTLTVIKDLGLKEPYVGRTDLVSGEIAQDFTRYFAVSEQQPSAVALGVRAGEGNKIISAAGMIIQVLPGADEEAVKAVEDTVFFMDSISLVAMDAQEMNAQLPVKTMMDLIFKNIPEEYAPEVLETRELKWNCGCSRERMEQALISIGKKDLKDIIDTDGKAELTCQFCRSKYGFTKEELEALLEEAAG